MIEMVVFDADQTLWDFHHGMRRSLANRVVELQARFPEEAAGLSVEAMMDHRRRVAQEHPHVIDMADVRRRAFGYTVASIGVEERAVPKAIAYLVSDVLSDEPIAETCTFDEG